MKTLFTILFILVTSGVQAQVTVTPKTKKLQQFYLGFGLGGAYTNADNFKSSGDGTSICLSATFRNNLLVRSGYLYATFQDNLERSEHGEEFKFSAPYHTLDSYYLALGKKTTVSKYFQFQAFTGISFTNYKEPENIKLVEKGGFGVFGYYSIVEYNIKSYHKPGLIFQAEAMALPLRFAGLTLGTYYHFVPKISNGGFNLSLNLGRIRLKESKIL